MNLLFLIVLLALVGTVISGGGIGSYCTENEQCYTPTHTCCYDKEYKQVCVLNPITECVIFPDPTTKKPSDELFKTTMSE